MAIWTDELKAKVVEMYKAAEPTAETSTEIVKDIAEEIEMSANGVRQVLVQANVYVKKDTATKGTSTKPAASGDKAPRVSKESQIAELKALIEAKGKEADDEVLSKLTGKAAAYLVKVFS